MPEFTPASPEKRGPKTENIPAQEQAPVQSPEFGTPASVQVPAEFGSAHSESQAAPVHQPTALEAQVESVLEQDLGTLYRDLSPEAKLQFKQDGERVAIQIAGLLERAKVKVAQIIKLIREWLVRLPGVSKYFVEQAAKIKADKIIHLK